MKLSSIRQILFTAIVLILILSLCGCDLMGSLENMLGGYTGAEQRAEAEQQIDLGSLFSNENVPEDFMVEDEEYVWSDGQFGDSITEEPIIPEESAEIQEDPYGIVVCDILNVRSGPGTDYEVTEMIYMGTYLDIYELRMRQEMPWAETQYGWVCLDFVRLNDPTMIHGEYVGPHKGTVWVLTATLREGPGEHYDVVGSLSSNQRIEYDTRCSNWVRYGEGWLCLDEVQLDGTVSQRWGTVNATDVNIRTGPDTDYAICGKANTGDRLVIYETTDRGGRRWGRCDEGWICMDYVDLDS